MVSNRLSLELSDLLEVPEKLRREHSSDPEYQDLRGMFPPEWPLHLQCSHLRGTGRKSKPARTAAYKLAAAHRTGNPALAVSASLHYPMESLDWDDPYEI